MISIFSSENYMKIITPIIELKLVKKYFYSCIEDRISIDCYFFCYI